MKLISALMLAFCVSISVEKLAIAGTSFSAAPDSTPPTPNCTLYQIQGTFSAVSATYNLSGTCAGDAGPIRWTARGSYNSGATQTNTAERISLLGTTVDNVALGTIQSVMLCDADPWLVNLTCRANTIKLSATGAVSQPQWQSYLQELIQTRWVKPATAALNYDRDALNAKRRADLDAAKRQAELAQRRFSQSKSGMQTSLVFRPQILSPTAGQRFYAQTPISIKLSPPQGWNVNSYIVSIQKKNAKGGWDLQTNIPVSAVEAQSAQGYTGFGAGGNGPMKSAAFLTGPGTWRLAAQVSSPRQSGWSNPVEFQVAPLAPLNLPAGALQRRLVK